MAQLVTRLDDQLVANVDRLVADGVVANRSEAVRLGLEKLVDEHRRPRSQTDQELTGLDAATRALVDEEPW